MTLGDSRMMGNRIWISNRVKKQKLLLYIGFKIYIFRTVAITASTRNFETRNLTERLSGTFFFCFGACDFVIYNCCLVTKSGLTLCDPVDCNMPGFPVLPISQSLFKLMSIELVMPSNFSSSVIPFSSCHHSFPASGSFPRSQFFASGGQSIGVSASTSALPVNTQDWSPLGLTGWISLQSKGLSRVFSNTTVQKHQFFGAQLSL